MTERSDPSALRWLIGNELRRYRTQAQQSAASAAVAIGCSTSKVTHLETARYQPQADEIAKLLRFYGANQHDIDRLTTLAGQMNAPTWWAPWSNVIADWFRTFVGLEGLAMTKFNYEQAAVPGLLQTEDYAEALTRGTDFVRPDQNERFVEFRLARARRLTDPEPLILHAVIGEAALRLQVGSSEVLRAQYQHLIDLAALPNVRLQVLRPEDGPYSALFGAFSILEFPHVRPIVYNELLDGAVYVQDPDGVAAYNMAAENLEDVALPHDESVALIRSLV